MAADAKIQRVEELAAYSNHLGGFIESMSKNFTSFNNVMMQKLEVLRRKLRQAEEMEAEAIAEWKQKENELAYCSSEEVEQRRKLLAELKDAEHKKGAAQRMKSEISTLYNVAVGEVRCMHDNTQLIQNKLRDNIAKGRQFLKNASVQLEQYKDNVKKI